jgi:hypothetical protein
VGELQRLQPLCRRAIVANDAWRGATTVNSAAAAVAADDVVTVEGLQQAATTTCTVGGAWRGFGIERPDHRSTRYRIAIQ